MAGVLGGERATIVAAVALPGAADALAGAVADVLRTLRRIYPNSDIVLVSILPRGATEADPLRGVLRRANQLLAGCADQRIHYVDAWAGFLRADGGLSAGLMPDLLH